MKKDNKLSEEEIWKIIEERYNDKSDYTKRFIFQAMQKFGDEYDYYKTDREKNSTRVIITCRVHGDFSIDPGYFLRAFRCKGCKKCHPHINSGVVKTMESFEKELKDIFPQFSLIEGQKYVNNHIPLKFHCNTHNIDFEERPANICCGKCGCPECNQERKIETRRKTDEERLLRFLHENVPNVDTSKVKYKDLDTKIILICRDCGESFEISPSRIKSQLRSSNKTLCPYCRDSLYLEKRKQNFITKAKAVWGDKMDYSNIKYYSNKKVEGIKCNICGDIFTTGGGNHLQGYVSCSCQCNSNGEKYTREILSTKGIDYEEQVKVTEIEGRNGPGSVVFIDFVFEYNNFDYWIECDGEQHYFRAKHFQNTEEKYIGQLTRDVNIYNYTKEHNIIFIKIPYTYYDLDKINNIIDYALGGGDPFSYIKYPKVKYPEKYGGERIQYGTQ